MMGGNLALLYFLIGLGTATKVNIVGFVGISQIFVFLAAPFLYLTDFRQMKKDGFLTLANLALLAFVGCIISSVYNETDVRLMARGLALCYTQFASIVVFYHLMKRDLAGLKWYFVGLALSQVITIWGFRSGVETATMVMSGESMIKEREMYLMAHFGGLFTLPLFAFFLQTPALVSLGIGCFPALYTIVTTSSGRSAVLTTIMTAVLILFTGRSVSKMIKFKKRFVAIMTIVVVGGMAFASLYKYLGVNGMLNESANKKYEAQMANAKSGILGKLMAGRAEFFVGIEAIMDNPIWGCGPWPIDKKGYYERFITKYGSAEDVNKYCGYIEWRRRFGIVVSRIPIHSEILCGWIYNSIFGLPYYLYLLWLIFTVLRKHIDAVPQWFGYFAMIIPGTLWNLFFSPPASDISPFAAMLLFALAIGRGKRMLPEKMYWEAVKHDR